MNIRRLFAIFSLMLLGGILVACGTDDDEVAPTATVESIAPEPTDEPVEVSPAAETEPADDATAPVASPIATPVDADATPSAEDATPVADATVLPVEATPAVAESDDATPVSDAAVVPLEATPAMAEAGATPVTMVPISGTLTLDGREQQDYTLSAEGCIGLGEWRQLKPGAQVIVRDAAGAVVDIAMLESAESDDCAWTFAIEAPDADFFSISIPMVTEVWFDQNDPAVESGEVEMFVP